MSFSRSPTWTQRAGSPSSAPDCAGLRQTRQPADALLLLDRHPRRVDVALEGVRAFERLARPELHRGQAKRQARGRDHQARVHQQPALRVGPRVAVAIPSDRHPADRADGLGLGPAETELGGVLHHEDRTIGGREAARGCPEVTSQDRVLAEPITREEAVGSLRIGPVLASQRQGRAHRPLELVQQSPQPVATALVAERAPSQFGINPRYPAGSSHNRTIAASPPRRF